MKESSPILVVDDSPTQVAVLKDALEARGFVVRTAGNGVEAIAAVYQSPPRLILSDVMMPEMNGYHLCRLLKNDPYTEGIPIILLTQLSEQHDRFWGENAGADLYLEKSADLSLIIEAVESLLAEGRGRKACALPTPPLAEPSSGDLKTRLTGILDRLLYESTISNEILKLTALAHDTDLLVRELFRFITAISRYSVGALLLREGQEKNLLAFHLAEPISPRSLDQARAEIFRLAGLEEPDAAHLKLLILDEHNLNGGSPLHLLQTFPVRDGDELLASLTLLSLEESPLTEGMRHALNVVADRFLVVARYLKKFREIEEVKADFISMLVHDLRSPLTSIKGFTDALAGGLLGKVTEEQESALNNIQGGCDRLLGLIEDILDLSKLEAGKMLIHSAPLHLRPLALQVIKDLSALFLEKNMQVALDIPEETPHVLGDSKQLARVLVNLLTNAAKFSPTGGEILLRAHVPERCRSNEMDDCVQVDVCDNGVGIPAHQQRALFSRYQQLSSAGGGHRKGTGLGLAICKEIIHLHNGKVWVESPLCNNRGSRFSFTLPLA